MKYVLIIMLWTGMPGASRYVLATDLDGMTACFGAVVNVLGRFPSSLYPLQVQCLPIKSREV